MQGETEMVAAAGYGALGARVQQFPHQGPDTLPGGVAAIQRLHGSREQARVIAEGAEMLANQLVGYAPAPRQNVAGPQQAPRIGGIVSMLHDVADEVADYQIRATNALESISRQFAG